MTIESYPERSAFDTDSHLRPLVATEITPSHLERRIHYLSSLQNRNLEYRGISTSEYPWLFDAGEEMKLRPKEDLQESMQKLYSGVTQQITKFPKSTYASRVRDCGAIVWADTPYLFIRFDEKTQQQTTIFSFEERLDRIAWSVIRQDLAKLSKSDSYPEEDVTLLCEPPMSAYMALRAAELLIKTVPNNGHYD